MQSGKYGTYIVLAYYRQLAVHRFAKPVQMQKASAGGRIHYLNRRQNQHGIGVRDKFTMYERKYSRGVVDGERFFPAGDGMTLLDPICVDNHILGILWNVSVHTYSLLLAKHYIKKVRTDGNLDGRGPISPTQSFVFALFSASSAIPKNQHAAN